MYFCFLFNAGCQHRLSVLFVFLAQKNGSSKSTPPPPNNFLFMNLREFHFQRRLYKVSGADELKVLALF